MSLRSLLRVAALAATALGCLLAQTARDVPQLIQQLKSDASDVRSAAAEALGRIGADAVPALINALQDDHVYVRLYAARVLGRIGADAKDAVPTLVAALQDDNEWVRAVTVEALRNIGPDAIDAVPALVSGFRDDDKNIRYSFARAVGFIGAAAVPALVAALQSEHEKARVHAAQALAEIGPDAKEAVPALVAALQDEDEDEECRILSAGALASIGAAAVPALIAALQDDDKWVRLHAASALGNIGADAKEAVPALASTCQDDDEDVRGSAVKALGLIGGGDAVSALIIALQDDDYDVRDNAAAGLVLIGPDDAKEAVPALIAALQDGDVRNAASALASIAKGLQDNRSVDAIPELAEAELALENAGYDDQAEDVRRAVEALEAFEKNLWSTRIAQFFSWAKGHPWWATALFLLIAYLAWFLILRFGVLPRAPLRLLRWNENLATLDYKLPKWAGEATVSFSKVVLIGFYHYHPRLLEAWVGHHANHARQKLHSLETAQLRKTYVPLPVRMDGKVVTELTAELLQQTCARKRWCLLLKGEGGLGKTTLALQMARWALAEKPSERLCRDRQMLPVLLEPGLGFDVRQDMAIFKSEIRGRLRILVGAEKAIPEGLLERLLEDRQVLVILDGLSEMSTLAGGPGTAHPQNPDFSVNALLATSRVEEKLAQDATIQPQRIDTNHLLPFINAYLTEAGCEELTDSELFEASRRLADLVTMVTGITPLLGRLFAEQLVGLQDRGESIEKLPRSVPDLMLEYLNSLNRQREQEDPDDPTVHAAAKIAAWECVKETFKPGQSGTKARIREALIGAELSETLLEDLEQRLRIVKTVGAGKLHVQFELDPLSEYLAALTVVEDNAGNEGQWREFLNEADAKPGAPETIQGFLAAVRDCCLAKPKHEVPGFVADELAKRVGLDSEVLEAAKRKRRVQPRW